MKGPQRGAARFRFMGPSWCDARRTGAKPFERNTRQHARLATLRPLYDEGDCLQLNYSNNIKHFRCVHTIMSPVKVRPEACTVSFKHCTYYLLFQLTISRAWAWYTVSSKTSIVSNDADRFMGFTFRIRIYTLGFIFLRFCSPWNYDWISHYQYGEPTDSPLQRLHRQSLPHSCREVAYTGLSRGSPFSSLNAINFAKVCFLMYFILYLVLIVYWIWTLSRGKGRDWDQASFASDFKIKLHF